MQSLNRLDLIGSFQSGFQNALVSGQAMQQMHAQQEEMKRQGEMRNWLTPENAAALVQGDQNALATFAQLSGDPMAAVNIGLKTRADTRATEQHGQQTELNEARLKKITAEMTAQEAAQARQESQQAVVIASTAQTPEEWDRLARQYGAEDLVGQFDRKDEVIAGFMTFDQLLEQREAEAAAGQPDWVTIDGQLVNRNAEGGPAVADVTGLRSTPGPTEAEMEIARLLEIPGVTRETAIKIKEGVYKIHTDPVDRNTYIIDMTTRQPVQLIGADGAQVGGGQPSPGQPGQTGQAAPMAPAQQPQPGPRQAAGQPNLSFGQDVPTNGEQAFGLGGVLRNAANTASDALGMGEVFPNAAEHQRFFRLVEEDLLVDLSQAYGRQPAMQLMERIRSLLPQAGTLEGAERARGELEELKRRFSRDLASVQSQMTAPGRMRPEDRDAMRERAGGLRSTLGTIDEAITRLGGAPGGDDGSSGTTSSGISWSIE